MGGHRGNRAPAHPGTETARTLSARKRRRHRQLYHEREHLLHDATITPLIPGRPILAKRDAKKLHQIQAQQVRKLYTKTNILRKQISFLHSVYPMAANLITTTTTNRSR